MPSSSLEDQKIFLNPEMTRESLEDCPSRLKDFLTLILDVALLRWDYFGGTLGGSRSVQATPIMQYQSELKLEAEELAIICSDPKRSDDTEEKWVEVLGVVFYRFDRGKEEVYARKRHHHCFICGKHFPLRSRPLLNRYSSRVYDEKLLSVHGDDKDLDDADVCRVHKNIPNFDIDKPTYKEFQHNGKKIPDRTIGLLAWSENAWHPPPGMNQSEMDEILTHSSVKPFCNDVLQTLRDEGLIESLFKFPSKRVTRSSLTFPFAIWEAKKASEGNAVTQNALQVKMILEWQRAVAERANIQWEPLVFHFVSAGSEWKLYACHIQVSRRSSVRTYPFRLLWSGHCANPEKALQLLYLVDLIALWGQFQYKPFAGACIEIFRRGNGLKSFLRTNLLKHQKEITMSNFRSIQSFRIPATSSVKPYTKLRRAGTDTPVAEIEKQLSQKLRKLSIKDYFIPEKDGFIWLMHRQLGGCDLVVIRVNMDGRVLDPLVIFKSPNWNSEEFEEITQEEKARMPRNIEVDFSYNKKNRSVLRRCFDVADGYCRRPEIQFCAILPLKRKSNSNSDNSTYNGFQSLARLLGLQKLIDAARKQNLLWCTCQQPEADSMILCDATTCATGWYHKKCVGLKEDFELAHWVCPTCVEDTKSRDRISLSKYDNGGEFGEETHARSDARIQRVRSLRRAWDKHDWPNPSKVQKLYNQICCEIEMETGKDDFYDTIERLRKDRFLPATQCWAVLRDDPGKMTHIRERFRGGRIS